MANSSSSLRANPSVSVIIPVYNDSKRLAICLRALENQTYPQNLYEVIVVDNGSNDNLESHIHQFPQAIFIKEDQPGSYAARNKGISVATGEVIAFTDSDCIPNSDWVERGLSTLQSVPNCGLIAGRISLRFRNPEKPTAVEIYESLNAFKQKNMVEKYQHGATANLFTFKSVLDQVGIFNDSLKSGGDVEWGKRVYAHGYNQAYAEEACVAHPARYSLGELYRKVTRVTGGIHDMEDPNSFSFFAISEDLIKLTIFLLALLRRAFFGMPPFDNLNGHKQGLQYISVVAFVGLVKIRERIRLQSGHKPRRQ